MRRLATCPAAPLGNLKLGGFLPPRAQKLWKRTVESICGLWFGRNLGCWVFWVGRGFVGRGSWMSPSDPGYMRDVQSCVRDMESGVSGKRFMGYVGIVDR